MDAPTALAVFELLESSSSSSEDEYQLIDLICEIVQHSRGKRRVVRNFSEESVEALSRRQFVRQYRIAPELCDYLVGLFEESSYFPRRPPGGGSASISAKKHILCFLWYVGHTTNSFRSIVQRFDLTKDSFSHILSRVNSFLSELSAKVIKWPDDTGMTKCVEEFQNKFELRNVIGCIASVHVKINPPALDSEVYLNKKGKHSIQMQVICDCKGQFIDVFVGHPGSAHKAAVLESCLIYEKLPELCKDKHIIGDAVYPLKPWLLTPYPDGDLTQTQDNYNKKLESCAVITDTAFSAIRRRFPILCFVPLRRESEICRTILSCCAIHNLADVNDLELFDDEELVDSDGDEPMPKDDPYNVNEANLESYQAGVRLRDAMAEGT